MSEQYWIGGFFIDLSRNQISQNQQSQTLAPKALAVLTYLAENQGRVVSYDELFDKVWPDTVVSPNTLQRSVAQLRKALGDDGKGQVYIQTHAKQGYSLECDVHWQKNLEAITATSAQAKADEETQASETSAEISEKSDSCDENTVVRSRTSLLPWISNLGLLSLLTAVLVLAIVGVKYFTSSPDFTLSVSKIRSLTATDHKEFGGIYSPDGEYIVFSRYSEKLCIESNIWAKNIKTQKETQLTPKMGIYGRHSFSKDGKKLIFVESESCVKPITQKTCYKLKTLDFETALKSPQSPELLMECKNSRIAKPIWLNNNNIALMQEASNRWQLLNYSIADNSSTVIFSREDGNFIDYDYSVKDDLIALTSVNNDGQTFIEILKPDGQLVSSHPIEYPDEIANLRLIFPNFTPLSDLLIFSTGRQLFTLTFDGKVTNISLPLDEPMGSPIFHPDGKRMLVIKGQWDSDIVTLPLSQLSEVAPAAINTNHFTTIARSTTAEDDAIFQPQGDLIAFTSDRTGEDQIWLTDDKGLRQLTHFPMDSYIKGFDWAADGQSVLVNVDNVLTQVGLDASKTSVPFKYRVEQLFQWQSQESTALIHARINGGLTLVEVNLNSLDYKVITDKKVTWALKTDDGRLIYTDRMDRFWQSGPVEDQLIEPLIQQGSERGFIVKDKVIYGINEQLQLWSYDMSQDTFTTLTQLPEKVDFITDMNHSDILLTYRISAKKEVAELILAD